MTDETPDGDSDGAGLPAVAPLTGDEEQERRATEGCRDALRAAWVAVDEATEARGPCPDARDGRPHHHHRAPEGGDTIGEHREGGPECRGHTSGPDYLRWSAWPVVECPGGGPGLRDLLHSAGLTHSAGRLVVSSDGLWVWRRLDGCGAREPGDDDHPGPDECGDHWTAPGEAPLSLLRRLAPEVGPLLAAARVHALERLRVDREACDAARAVLPQPEQVPRA